MKKHIQFLIAFSFILTVISSNVIAAESSNMHPPLKPYKLAPAASIDQVLSALKSGNAGQLAKFLDSRVDISLPNKSDNFSKNQAEMILKDFFASNEVKNFVVKHKGENNGSQFCIGLLETRNGNYRTKLYMKQKGDQQVVQEIAFQAED